jgi:hypothetical protein
MTYREIAETFQDLYGVSCKPCWIAHMKALLGLIPDREARAYPCPTKYRGKPRGTQTNAWATGAVGWVLQIGNW